MKGGHFRDNKKIFEKKTKNRKIRILSQSHSAEKLGRGDPLGFLKLQLAVKFQKKLEGGTLWRQKKFEKKSHSAEKNSKGGPYSLVRFCILR